MKSSATSCTKSVFVHVHVASSLKPFSHIYSRPITSPFVDKLAMTSHLIKRAPRVNYKLL